MDASQKISPKPDSVLIQRKSVRYRFTSPVSKEKFEKASMSDSFINYQASREAVDQYKNSFSRTAEKGVLFLGIPIASSIAEGALSPAKSVIDKVKTTLNAGKKWGIALAGVLGGYSLIDAATKKIPVLREFRENHPGTTTIGTIAGTIGAAYGANKAVDSIASQVAKIKAKGTTIGNMVKSQTDKLLARLEKSGADKILEQKVFEPAKKFITKTHADKWGLPVVIGGVIGKILYDRAEITKNAEKIKSKLENERAESIKELKANPLSEKPVMKTEIKSRILIVPADAK